MPSNSLEMVINLKDSQSKLAEIRSDIERRDLITDSEHLESIFSTVKSNLLRSVNFMDQIAAFDPKKLERNQQQKENVQSLANLAQRNLAEARMAMDSLSEEEVLPINEKLLEELPQLYVSFQALVDIYSSEIADNHLSFRRFDQLEASLLPYTPVNKIFTGDSLLVFHHDLLTTALKDFIKLGDHSSGASERPGRRLNLFGDNAFNKKKFANTLFLRQFLALNNELSDEVELIHQDCEELDLAKEPIELPYLEDFASLITSIRNYETEPKEILEAVKSDQAYSDLANRLFKPVVGRVEDIKLSDLVRAALTLQALRIKYMNEEVHPDLNYDQALAQQAKALADNDRPIPEKAAILSTMKLYVDGELEKLDMQDMNKKALYKSGLILADDTKAIMQDADNAITIRRLKKEINREKGIIKALVDRESETNRLFEKYRQILGKAGVHKDRFTKLSLRPDNSTLKSFIEDIFQAAIRYNSIDQAQAAELIYILSESYAVDAGQIAMLEIITSFNNTDAKNISDAEISRKLIDSFYKKIEHIVNKPNYQDIPNKP